MRRSNFFEGVQSLLKYKVVSTNKNFPIKELKKIYDWKIEKMSPTDFLDYSDFERYQVDYKKVTDFVNKIYNGGTVIPIPILIFKDKDKKLKTSFHDGTHRVLALKKIGLSQIEVLCFYEKENK